jgi:gamma-tubulin complex component 2
LNKEVVAGKIRDVTLMRLQSHLGMVLGSSSCVGYSDPYREDVRIHLATENAYDHLKRIAEIRGGMEEARAQAKMAKHRERDRVPLMDLLEFDLKVKFPVSLVISKKNILRWQFLQRIIVHLKAVERALCEVWMEHREPAWRRIEKNNPALQQWKMRIMKLRHRILFFVQQVLAFMTEEVLEPNWRDLEVKMEKAKTVDQFLKDHFDFLNTCRKECMLIDYRYLEVSRYYIDNV